MISCVLRGRLGNQMFIAATTISHAIKQGVPYVFPSRSGKRQQFPFMFYHELPTIKGYDILKVKSLCREQEFGKYHPLPNSSNICLRGYFQSEKYFYEHRDILIDLFKIPVLPVIKGKVGVHVRRGDYIKLQHKHTLINSDWIRDAMNEFPDHEFTFFSDDIAWCAKEFEGKNITFDLTTNPKKIVSEMTSCEHFIMSPSSLSWWGNWIASNNRKGRKVIVHKDWFNPSYTKLKSDDIVPDNWTKL